MKNNGRRTLLYPERKELTKDEYKRLVKTAFDNGNERLALVLETICASGIRVSELSFITVAAIHKGQAEIECKGRIRTVLLTRQLCSLLYSGIMLIGLMVFHLMTPQLLMLFQADEEMLAIGVPALRIISLSFLFAGYCIIVGSVFQALGNGVYSLIISVARQLVCILPLAWFFARTFGLHAVWLSLPLAEITSVVLSSILFRKIYLDKIKPLGQAAA